MFCTVSVIVPPLVRAADGERPLGFNCHPHPPKLLGKKTEQPCTKYLATDWTLPRLVPQADKTLRGAALTCSSRLTSMLTW